MAMIPQEWTVSGLATEFGVDRRAIGKKLAGVTPIREEGKSKYYLMRDVLDAYFGGGKPSGNLEEERTRLAAAQANKVELEVEVMRANLIPGDKVEQVWTKMLSAFRARCLSIPTKAAATVIGMDDLNLVESTIRTYIYEALTELSEYESEQYIDGGKKVSKDSGATAGDDS